MHEVTPRFQWRALVSVVTGFSFLFLVTSGVVLFLAPPGRVANWTNWAIVGLRKSDWAGLHIWFSAIFLIGSAVHIFLNLRPLISYFKNKATRRVGLRAEWVAAGAVCLVVFGGTRANLPPFTSLLAWNEELKESWDRPAERAPIPHAELLTLAALAEKGGVDLATATARLTASGVTGFAPDMVVQKIADGSKRSARQIYDIIITGPKGPGGHAEGKTGGGPGSKTLTQLCADEGIELKTAIGRLEAKGVKASAELLLREIARNNGDRKPYELLEIIRGQ